MPDHTTSTPKTETPTNEPRKYCTNPECNRAGQLLPLSDFHIDKNKKDGHVTRCKDCVKKHEQEKKALAQENPINKTHKYCGSATCERAGQLLPVEEFNKSARIPDGHSNTCRQCVSKHLKKHRDSDEVQRKATEYQKGFSKTPKGREYNRLYSRKYRKTPKSKLNTEKRKILYPEKYNAWRILHNAVDAGKMPRIKTLTCYICGHPAQEYHHHLGYEPEHALDVIPVCKICHTRIHNPPA